MTRSLSDDYSHRARTIIFAHYTKDGFKVEDNEICRFWREMTVDELDYRIKNEWNFINWKELKQCEHFGGLWNLPGGKVLLFADFESFPQIEMIPLEKAFNVDKLMSH